MKKLLVGALVLVMLGYLVRAMMKPVLNHFEPSEFGVWWPMMSNDLLVKLDRFRELWGGPVEVSSAHGGIGREEPGSESQHNVLQWGEVRAVDAFPKLRNLDGSYRYVQTASERRLMRDIAQQAGFSGIGIYTDTQPGNMLHVDVREDRTAYSPAMWSRVGGEYFGIDEVIA